MREPNHNERRRQAQMQERNARMNMRMLGNQLELLRLAEADPGNKRAARFKRKLERLRERMPAERMDVVKETR